MHTISAEQLLKAYNGKYKYVTMNIGEVVWVHVIKPYYENGIWVSDRRRLMLNQIAITEFQNKPSEECIYKAKPSEEDWIGCVGWFWDEEDDEKELSFLTRIDVCEERYRYLAQGSAPFIHFRPATRDEIKFFNDDTSEE